MTQFIEPKYFTKAFTAFNEELSLPTDCVPFTDAKFGLLNLQAIACGPSDITHELVLVIDNSGSMNDKCFGDNNKTQMEQAIYTLTKIIGYLEENPNIKANVTIFKFDDKFKTVLERTTITEENFERVEKLIKKIRPDGETNIEQALKETTKYISGLKTLYPSHQISHIFLTDGAVTKGQERPLILKDYVDYTIYNYFIGYGSKHDYALLRTLSNFEKSSYHYIDALEKTGFVFGEILHNITHKVLYDCEIVIENGVIYNFKTNLYTNKLYIGDIIGESNKVYHLFSDHPTNCYVHLKAKSPAFREPLEIHIFQEIDNDTNFVNYAFRHRTLTLLGEVKKCQETFTNSSRYKHDVNYYSYENISANKLKMQNLFDEMRKYMEENDKQNKFIKMLCDDIHISMKTFGTKYGNMCISSRQTSQGTQQIYTVNTTPLDYVNVNVNVNVNSRSFSYNPYDLDEDVHQRGSSINFNNDSDSDEYNQKGAASSFNNNLDGDSDEEIQKAAPRPRQRSCGPSLSINPDPFDDYEVSKDCMEDSPYLTNTATNVMRSISYNSEEEDDNNDNINKEDDSDSDSMPSLVPINNDDSDSDDNDDQ